MSELLHRDWLDSHTNFEAQAGKIEGISLDQAILLTELLGNPQKDYKAIHITGTNGKGSTAHILTHLLVASGFNVGTYSSPHVLTLNERIQFNGVPIPNEELEKGIGQVKEVEEKSETRFSWFELVTATALNWFSKKKIDVAIVEVGKLGRFDATNVINAEVCVVTNISQDHTDGEGEWEKAIAWEKAGIIKSGSSLISGVVKSETNEPNKASKTNKTSEPNKASEIREIFEAENPAESYYLGQDIKCTKNEAAEGGRSLSIQTSIAAPNKFEDLFLSLHGAHQGKNAALALGIAQTFLKKLPEPKEIAPEVVAQVFSKISVTGRFEILSEEPLFIVDGGHNFEGISAARQTLDNYLKGNNCLKDTDINAGINTGIEKSKNQKSKNSTLIFGLTAEKSVVEMLTAVKAETFTQVICTNLPTPRTRDSKELDMIARQQGINSIAIKNPADALKQSMESDLIFVCGSLYLAGAIKEAFMALQSIIKVNT